LLQDAVEQLQDELLLGLGQAGQALDALLQLRCRSALGRWGLVNRAGFPGDSLL
jgi:hypothetical protein